MLDTSETLDSKIVYRNAQIIAKTLVAHLYDYNTSETPKIVSTILFFEFIEYYHLIIKKKKMLVNKHCTCI